MVKISTLDTSIRHEGNFSYRTIGHDLIGYSKPALWSYHMPIGFVGIASNERGFGMLHAGMEGIRRLVYTLPTALIQDLRANDSEKNLKASRGLGDDYRRLFVGHPFFLIYFVGEKRQEIYEIPSSIVLASGHDPEAFTHDVLVYLAGQPAVAVSHERGKYAHTDITEAKALERLNRLLRGKYEKPLKALEFKVTGYQSGLVVPVNGVGKPQKQDKLEILAQASS